MANTEFKNMPEPDQKATILSYLSMGMRSIMAMKQDGSKPKTDAVGYACQYGAVYKLTRQDFDSILNVPLNEVLADFNNRYEARFKPKKKLS